MTENEYIDGRISGVQMNLGGPAFTHVMYADDLILFSKENRREATILNECLEKYCLWSGQLVNRDKSGLVFSKLVQKER
jgi:hypothetical protein